MNAENPQRRLKEAEAQLNQALERLHALRRAALFGNYDAAEFDRAVMAYREAEMAAQRARAAWAGTGPAAGEPAGLADIEEVPRPFEPTPHMRFIRWLVQTGRLSDWEVESRVEQRVR